MVKKYKKENDTSFAMGATLVMELLNKRSECARAVYVSQKNSVSAVEERAQELGVPVVRGEKPFNILGAKGNCFAIGEFQKFSDGISADRHHIVLVNPSDCGNLGTIMREAAAFDAVDLAIISPCADPFDPKTVRASMGAVFDISFKVFDSFDSYAAEFEKERVVVPFMLGGEPLSGMSFDKNKKYALVFGNEATGLPQEFMRYGAVRIEQSQKVDSLNLSVAAAIGLYKLYCA